MVPPGENVLQHRRNVQRAKGWDRTTEANQNRDGEIKRGKKSCRRECKEKRDREEKRDCKRSNIHLRIARWTWRSLTLAHTYIPSIRAREFDIFSQIRTPPTLLPLLPRPSIFFPHFLSLRRVIRVCTQKRPKKWTNWRDRAGLSRFPWESCPLGLFSIYSSPGHVHKITPLSLSFLTATSYRKYIYVWCLHRGFNTKLSNYYFKFTIFRSFLREKKKKTNYEKLKKWFFLVFQLFYKSDSFIIWQIWKKVQHCLVDSMYRKGGYENGTIGHSFVFDLNLLIILGRSHRFVTSNCGIQ